MQKQIENMEQLVNIILAMNAPRKEGQAPLQPSVSLPTPFGKMTVRVIDYDFVSADPSLKKLETQSAKAASLAKVVEQTLGSYRDGYRRALAASDLISNGLHTVKAENTTIWLLEGQRPAEDPDGQNQKWKVVASVSFELPADHELVIR